jgi:hypothetical protein
MGWDGMGALCWLCWVIHFFKHVVKFVLFILSGKNSTERKNEDIAAKCEPICIEKKRFIAIFCALRGGGDELSKFEDGQNSLNKANKFVDIFF